MDVYISCKTAYLRHCLNKILTKYSKTKTISLLNQADSCAKQIAELEGWWEKNTYARTTYSASIRDLSAGASEQSE